MAAGIARALALALALLVAALGVLGAPASKRKGGAGKAAGAALDETFFTRWNSFKELEAFTAALAKRHKKSKLVKLSSIGKSAEHRSLTLLSVGPAKPTHQLMLMGTMHGREWITPHAVLYVAWRLLTGLEQGDTRVAALLQDTQVHFLPVLNPDGYEFTRLPADKNEQAREWRKNRRNLCSKCERGVHGIDLNRNWGVKGKSWGFGADRATSEVYQGKRPFSEPEIKAVRDWLLRGKRGKAINGFFDVHCCSGAVLPPFYYNDEPEEVQKTNLDNCGQISKAMRSVNNVRYKHRPREAEFSDSNTGIGADWIYAEAGVQNVFIVETRGNKTKLLKYIFEVPETLILPISRELEAGFWKMAELLTPLAGPSSGSALPNALDEKAPPQQSLGEGHSQSHDDDDDDDDDDPGDVVANSAAAAAAAASDVGVEAATEKPAEPELAPAEMSLDDLLSNFADSFELGDGKGQASPNDSGASAMGFGASESDESEDNNDADEEPRENQQVASEDGGAGGDLDSLFSNLDDEQPGGSSAGIAVAEDSGAQDDVSEGDNEQEEETLGEEEEEEEATLEEDDEADDEADDTAGVETEEEEEENAAEEEVVEEEDEEAQEEEERAGDGDEVEEPQELAVDTTASGSESENIEQDLLDSEEPGEEEQEDGDAVETVAAEADEADEAEGPDLHESPETLGLGPRGEDSLEMGGGLDSLLANQEDDRVALQAPQERPAETVAESDAVSESDEDLERKAALLLGAEMDGEGEEETMDTEQDKARANLRAKYLSALHEDGSNSNKASGASLSAAAETKQAPVARFIAEHRIAISVAGGSQRVVAAGAGLVVAALVVCLWRQRRLRMRRLSKLK